MPSGFFPRAVSALSDSSAFGYVLEVDWDGDGNFNSELDNITEYTLAVESIRGRNYASQLTGRSQAGQLQAVLNNRDGRFSSFLASGPLYGDILPGRKVRLRTQFPQYVLWTGVLDRIEPKTAPGLEATATLYASGVFVKLSGPNNKVSPPALANTTTGAAVQAILDEAGWDSSRIVDAGSVEMRRWFTENVGALTALQEMEDAEQGFLYEGLAWDIVFESRYNRDVNHLTSEVTYSDDPALTYKYESIDQSDPLREIFNVFEATVQPYEVDSSAVLWTLSGESPSLAAGSSRTYIAAASSLNGDAVAYVEEWVTPVMGTDITQSGVSDSDVSVQVSKTARTMFITVTNNHATSAATITLMQARGTPVLKLNAFKISDEDAASQTAYGRRTYPLPSPWYGNSAFAEGTAEYVLARHAAPRPILTLGFTASKTAALRLESLQRQISDRVTVEADNNAMLGINGDFYVEAIRHRVTPGPLHQATLFLSPAAADPGYWQLDVDELDVGTKLAY